MDASTTRSVRRHLDPEQDVPARERPEQDAAETGSAPPAGPADDGPGTGGAGRDGRRTGSPKRPDEDQPATSSRRRVPSLDTIVRVSGTLLITLSIGLIAFCAIVVIWGDPFSRLTEQRHQDRLEDAFAQVEPSADDLAPASLGSPATRAIARQTKRRIPLGSAAGRISIPAIEVNQILVHGARDDKQDLDKGPGLYQDYPFPGAGKPLAIAGHRTTHGAPFLDVDLLDRGDRIVLTMPYGRFTYRVTRTEIVGVSAWKILDVGAFARSTAERRRAKASGRCEPTCEHLVLTACHPKYSAARRIAVFAQLDSVSRTKA